MISIQDVLIELLRRELRKGITQGELAQRLQIARQSVNQILGGRGRRVNTSHLDGYAETAGMPVSVLLRDLANIAWELENAAVAPPLPPKPHGAKGHTYVKPVRPPHAPRRARS